MLLTIVVAVHLKLLQLATNTYCWAEKSAPVHCWFFLQVLSVKFAWGNEEKPVSTFVLGCTPEYELALYSMAFFNRQEKNRVIIDDVPVELTCYRIRSKYGDKIGTAFPSAK